MVAVIEFERSHWHDETITSVAVIKLENDGQRKRQVLILTERLTNQDLTPSDPVELRTFADPPSLLKELVNMLCDTSPDSFFGNESSVYLTHLSEIDILTKQIRPIIETMPQPCPRLLLPMYWPSDRSTFRQMLSQIHPLIGKILFLSCPQ